MKGENERRMRERESREEASFDWKVGKGLFGELWGRSFWPGGNSGQNSQGAASVVCSGDRKVPAGGVEWTRGVGSGWIMESLPGPVQESGFYSEHRRVLLKDVKQANDTILIHIKKNYWRIITKCCVGFYGTAQWISYMYTYVSSFLDSLPI